ncbi:MAG: hypothetical protein DMG97_32180, partial [Acidobacteria bacterium]
MNTLDRWNNNVSRRVRRAMVPFALVAILVTNGAGAGMAQQTTQPTFTSAGEAIQTLFQAVESGNEDMIVSVLGG